MPRRPGGRESLRMTSALTSRNLWMAVKLAAFAVGAAILFQTAPQFVSAGGTSPAPAISPQAAPAQHNHAETHTEPRTATPRLTGIDVRQELDVPHWLGPGEYVWAGENAPAEGETVVVVNIRARVLSVYRAGVEIGRSSLIYGADNKPTPTGSFPILQKRADHWSNLYDAPMPHMLRLTWDGIAVHGSPELADDMATRGCVGLPREFARQLFDMVDVGDRVVIWDGETPLHIA